MAYPHTEYEVGMMTSGAITAGGVVGPNSIPLNASGSGTRGTGRWSPGAVPHIIRNVGVIPLTTNVYVTKPVISFRTGNSGVTALTTGNQITTITLASVAAQGKPYYKSALLNTIVNPGSDVGVVLTTKATVAGRARIVLYVEPKWETPANLTRMVAG